MNLTIYIASQPARYVRNLETSQSNNESFNEIKRYTHQTG